MHQQAEDERESDAATGSRDEDSGSGGSGGSGSGSGETSASSSCASGASSSESSDADGEGASDGEGGADAPASLPAVTRRLARLERKLTMSAASSAATRSRGAPHSHHRSSKSAPKQQQPAHAADPADAGSSGRRHAAAPKRAAAAACEDEGGDAGPLTKTPEGRMLMARMAALEEALAHRRSTGGNSSGGSSNASMQQVAPGTPTHLGSSKASSLVHAARPLSPLGLSSQPQTPGQQPPASTTPAPAPAAAGVTRLSLTSALIHPSAQPPSPGAAPPVQAPSLLQSLAAGQQQLQIRLEATFAEQRDELGNLAGAVDQIDGACLETAGAVVEVGCALAGLMHRVAFLEDVARSSPAAAAAQQAGGFPQLQPAQAEGLARPGSAGQVRSARVVAQQESKALRVIRQLERRLVALEESKKQQHQEEEERRGLAAENGAGLMGTIEALIADRLAAAVAEQQEAAQKLQQQQADAIAALQRRLDESELAVRCGASAATQGLMCAQAAVAEVSGRIERLAVASRQQIEGGEVKIQGQVSDLEQKIRQLDGRAVDLEVIGVVGERVGRLEERQRAVAQQVGALAAEQQEVKAQVTGHVADSRDKLLMLEGELASQVRCRGFILLLLGLPSYPCLILKTLFPPTPGRRPAAPVHLAT